MFFPFFYTSLGLIMVLILDEKSDHDAHTSDQNTEIDLYVRTFLWETIKYKYHGFDQIPDLPTFYT